MRSTSKKDPILHPDYAARLHEACEDLGIPKHRRSSTIAAWVSKAAGRDEKGNSEAPRRWLLGYNMPRAAEEAVIIENLNVNVDWLQYGRGQKKLVQTESDIVKEKLSNIQDTEIVDLLRNMTSEEIFTLKQFLKVMKK